MNNASDKFYDRLSFLYPVVDLFMKPQKRKFFSMINSYPHGRLLDIGVGSGNHLKLYSTHDIVGIDTSESMLTRARKHLNNNIELLKMNGQALSFPDEEFHYVILSHVIAVVEDPDKLIEEAYRVLKPGGKIFILNHFTPDNFLKYVDRSLKAISKVLHFKSVFYISSLRKIEKLKLLTDVPAGPFSYFKILIYEKNI